MSTKAGRSKALTRRLKKESAFYKYESFWSYFNRNSNFRFGVIIGPRQNGKTYLLAEHFLRDWTLNSENILYYFRLTDTQALNLLANNAEKMFDAPLVRKYLTKRGLFLRTRGNSVYVCRIDDDGKTIWKGSKKIAEVNALSTFYAAKGVATFDHEWLKGHPKRKYWIFVDEFSKEKNERSQGDLSYQFVNSLENILRNTKRHVRCIMACNLLEEANDILSGCFNFVPIKPGLYKLFSKKCVVHYVEPTKAYKAMRTGSVADILAPKASTFTNAVKRDIELLTKQRLYKPTAIIKFAKSDDHWFTLWDGNVIKKYNKQNCKTHFYMRPYLDGSFNKAIQATIIERFDLRGFLYADFITFKQFEQEIKMIKPRKA